MPLLIVHGRPISAPGHCLRARYSWTILYLWKDEYPAGVLLLKGEACEPWPVCRIRFLWYGETRASPTSTSVNKSSESKESKEKIRELDFLHKSLYRTLQRESVSERHCLRVLRSEWEPWRTDIAARRGPYASSRCMEQVYKSHHRLPYTVGTPRASSQSTWPAQYWSRGEP